MVFSFILTKIQIFDIIPLEKQRKEQITMDDNEKFTFEEVVELTENGYEEEMVWWFMNVLNDVIDNKQHMVTRQLKKELSKVFANDKLRSLLISTIELAEMAEFKMDSYSEFDLVLDYLLEIGEKLK